MQRVESGASDDARQLRVPVHLFDVALALVHEVELRRDVLQVCSARNRILCKGQA